MLPIFSLDDELFSDIAENARKSITRYAPEWTDFNAHDPGITMLELFSWLKELQQYHLDQISTANRLKFLKLFGMAPFHKQPAKAFVTVSELEEPLILPKGTVFFAGRICFENTEREDLVSRSVIEGFYRDGNLCVSMGNRAAIESDRMHFYLFGKEPREGAAFYFRIDQPLRKGVKENLYAEIFRDYPVKRNPLDEDFSPLASLKWECVSQGEWKEIKEVWDGTCGFVQSGQITLTLQEEMEQSRVLSVNTGTEEEGYWLRVILDKCDYDVAPVLTGISTNVIPLVQKQSQSVYEDFPIEEPKDLLSPSFTTETALALYGMTEVYLKTAEGWQETQAFSVKKDYDKKQVTVTLDEQCPWQDKTQVRVVSFSEAFFEDRSLGLGDGFPNQSFDIGQNEWMYEGFTLMVKEDSGVFTDWEKCIDFHSLGPEDRCYVFSEELMTLRFGDCDHGMAPEGELRIIGCAESLGKSGNVKTEKIDAFGDEEIRAKVRNKKNALGGEDQESVDGCFLRFRREMNRVDRAITYKDYETICRGTPGLMIRSCKAVPASRTLEKDGSVRENCIALVVQPFTGDKRKRLNPAYIRNLNRQFANKHLIGTKVSVLSPEYVGIVLFAEISVRPYYRDAKEQILKAAHEFFDEEGGWEFGKSVSYSGIYGIIDTLDCVVGIESLVMDAQGQGIKRSISGDVILPPNGMAYLKEAELVISAVE